MSWDVLANIRRHKDKFTSRILDIPDFQDFSVVAYDLVG